MYLIFYAVLFCYGGGGSGNHNYNDGKGQELSRYNCCNDAGCTKVNQRYKSEMKTNIKLAYEDYLHTVFN
jgi:hypothetical protein